MKNQDLLINHDVQASDIMIRITFIIMMILLYTLSPIMYP